MEKEAASADAAQRPEASRNRMLGLDLARGIAIGMMVVSHTMHEVGSEDFQASAGHSILQDVIASFAPAVFIFAMGMGFSLTRNSNLWKNLRRGLMLVLLGYILNACRGALPVGLALRTGAMSIEDLDPASMPGFLLQEIDILQFAGLAFILLTLLKHVCRSPWIAFALAGAVVFVSPLLWGITSGNPTLDFFLSLLWGTEEHVYFAQFPWLGFGLAGLGFGFLLPRVSSKDRLFGMALLPALTLAGVGLVLMQRDPEFLTQTIQEFIFNRPSPAAFLWMLGVGFGGLSLCHFLTRFIPANPIFAKLYDWSAHVTPFYFIQWTFLGWVVIEIGGLGVIGTLVVTFTAIIVSDWLTNLWVKSSRFLFPRKPRPAEAPSRHGSATLGEALP